MNTDRPEAPARLPAALRGLCDDAAIFPPGRAPLPEAVAAHLRYRRSWFAGLVGPLVVAPPALAALGALLPEGSSRGRAGAGAGSAAGASVVGSTVVGSGLVEPATGEVGPPAVSVTLPGGPAGLAEMLAAVARLPVTLRALEVAVPDGAGPAELLGDLDAALASQPALGGSGLDASRGGVSQSAGWGAPLHGLPEVFVEIPRDRRRDPLLAALAGSPYRAKFRTGGMRAELYPDDAELAASLAAAVAAGVPFKATAGLHHAVRNTDPQTGFEQHGFLNVLLAVDAVRRGGWEADARALLAERDGAAVAGLVSGMGEERALDARAAFLSFGTCSITDPLTELVRLGLVTAPATEGARA